MPPFTIDYHFIFILKVSKVNFFLRFHTEKEKIFKSFITNLKQAYSLSVELFFRYTIIVKNYYERTYTRHMLSEQSSSLLRGNVKTFAVVVIIGAAFTIVTSFVNDIITPLILVPELGKLLVEEYKLDMERCCIR